MRTLALTSPAAIARPARLLRTVHRTALVRWFNARGIGRHVDTYA